MTFEFGTDPAYLAALPLVGLRCLGTFAVAPLFGSRFVPAQVRVALGLLFGVLLLPLAFGAAPPIPMATVASPFEYAVRCGGELLLGLGVGYLALLFLTAAQVAGQVMDMELGFAMVNVLDPQFGFQLPLMGSLLNLIGILVFLALDGHLLLVRALRDSVLLLPPGGTGISAGAGELLVRAFATVFVTALKLAAPVVAALFLVSVALGIVARTVPQMNVFVVGLPLRIAVGITVLMLAMPYLGAVLGPALAGAFETINRLLAGLAG
jgi:flagellar biosynthetic protein FliR